MTFGSDIGSKRSEPRPDRLALPARVLRMNQTLLLAWMLLALGDPARARELLVTADAYLSRGAAVEDCAAEQTRSLSGTRGAVLARVSAIVKGNAVSRVSAQDAASSFGLRLDPAAVHPAALELPPPRPSRLRIDDVQRAARGLGHLVSEDAPRSPPSIDA